MLDPADKRMVVEAIKGKIQHLDMLIIREMDAEERGDVYLPYQHMLEESKKFQDFLRKVENKW